MDRLPAPSRIIAALFMVPFSASLAAQNWAELFPTTSPPGLVGHGMAYDLGNDVTVMFGGLTASITRVSDTWLFDGTNWTQATPANAPPARAGHPLAYDLSRGRVVLFGGYDGGTLFDDTWEWDGANWQRMSPATVPPARLSHPMVYHPGRGTCVMHGGNALGTTLTDTWEWNGVDWQQIPTASAPTPLRFATDMAYDPVGNGLVLFSGYPSSSQDTWYFDNVDWTLRATATVPPGRYDHTMTTDVVRNRVVMFGGTGTADTWEFDGTDWINTAPATLPIARYDDYLVYDLVRGQTLMFGGDFRNDTWAYQTPAQPGFAASIPYGTGCSGLWHRTDLRPVLGNALSFTTGPIPAAAVIAATVIGATEYNPGLDLTGQGMPGCFQYVSIDDAPLAAPMGGLAVTVITVPTSASLVGVEVKTQGVALVPGINPTGAITSNGLKLTIDVN